jgi:post-segregation antitoxin (ccd killing protein)
VSVWQALSFRMATQRYQATHMRSLRVGAILATVPIMSVQVTLPDDLAEQIDHVAVDRSAFVTEAVRRLLRESVKAIRDDEVARINAVADELNREAEDVLEYQALS